ncbi:aspartyl/glutamyl-tRNA(Asn/Gln) amidotransferase subunit B [Marivirga tractuosa]|uniref:Aspartyl/glutamyl-tRNA(Asn/Gln) amidotransferase subunit B n=1 Tax=Marivirga tractuosa (strain ATCC 23168 / DSM 4126 / NBRC 15989 / NCIMB 1408 / VKM B-1430 / H-43) TaxID=643867 RepID=E4TSU7_MARTH|nr:Asp-tRNA(Asn)/Glu-tRNA(Gln) amidotransferase subunit GatB [Marivirga tractuosa]ADR22888.1 aspartyl/glutamyl-tRNA(Asn/Gln) amidotransferase subunit B [Marivirga tractuosa DSM 4126]BDD16438.1 aspartyl/glutamyl-tRNA(Asn/Gln) amidotransferase subunit B [Marivirga tractuosa]
MSLDKSIRDQYRVVIGLEVHAQLLTESKLFCSDSTSFGASPNTHISPISLGHPGTLPKLNKKAVDYAIKMGLACECKITEENIFARKNYFYPDLPKGYQVTQDKAPICVGGKVWIKAKGETEEKAIALNRIHMEEDAGKSIHTEDASDTLVDYNRAGVPLIEIVTEPDLRSADEAYAFLTEVRRLVRYLEICDGNMEEGSLRCDANVSVMLKDAKEYGSKVEVKNMNSIRNVHRAIEHEAERLILLLEQGKKIISETRDFDAATGTTSSLRNKEELNDYRYFPEPDLSPLIVDEAWIKEIKARMPALPRELQQKFIEKYGIPEYDAQVLTDNKGIALYFDALCQETSNYKSASNWIMGTVKSYLNEHNIGIDQFSISPKKLGGLIQLVDAGKVSNTVANQQIFIEMLKSKEADAETIAVEANLLQESSSDSIQPIIDEVIKDMADKVKEYKSGRKGLIGLFVGEVMKRSKGKADPKKTNELLQQTLK